MNLNEIQQAAWQHAENKGFHKQHYTMAPWQHSLFTKLALIHTEVSEATEELRLAATIFELQDSLGFGSELADIIIRVADLAREAGIDLDSVVASKIEKNKSRSHLHGGKRA